MLNRRNAEGQGSGGDTDSSRTNSTVSKNIEYKIESQILKYFLSLAIGLQNIVGSFYISSQENSKTAQNELIIFGIFSIIINFAYGTSSSI